MRPAVALLTLTKWVTRPGGEGAAAALLTLTEWVTRPGGENQGAAAESRTIPLSSAREAKIMIFRGR